MSQDRIIGFFTIAR